MLNTNQANRLKEMSVSKTAASGKTNHGLTALVVQLKRESNEAFHTKDTLQFRKFFDEPKNLDRKEYKNYFQSAEKL